MYILYYVYFCQIKQVPSFLGYLQKNTVCEEIDLSDNYLEGSGAVALAGMLKDNMFIVTLVSIFDLIDRCMYTLYICICWAQTMIAYID